MEGLFSKLINIQLSAGTAFIYPGSGYLSVFTAGIRIFREGACIYCGKQFLGYRKAAVFSFCLLAFLAFLGNKEGNAAQA